MKPRDDSEGGGSRRDSRHGVGRSCLHPLHVWDDEGPEGRHAHPRVVLHEAHAGGAVAGRPTRRPGLVYRRDRVGKVGLERAARPVERGSSIVLHEGGFDPAERFELLERLGVNVLCQAPTEFRLMAKCTGTRALRPVRDPPRRLGRRAAQPGGHPCLPGRVRPDDPRRLRADREHTPRRQLPGMEIRPGSMGLPAPGHEVAVIDADGRSSRRARRGTSRCAAVRRRCSAATGKRPTRRRQSSAATGTSPVTGRSRDEDGYLWFAGSSGRRDPLGRLPHRAVRGRERAARACRGRRERRRRQAGCRTGGQIVKAFVVLRPGYEADRRAGRGSSRITRSG